jgi:4-diphosphocytidyl-2-C-methyl-D-erythritol kinase
MEELTFNTPAKINLGLRVIRKRDDGYHDIETVFYPINLFDTIIFRKSDKFSFSSNDKNLENYDNLIIKSKELLEKETNITFNIQIELQKNIPVGAGMGGGSADAAATLNALNQIYELKLSGTELFEFAINLGSDVPFFLDPQSSYATSRGEFLHRMDFRISQPILIVNPGIHISTKWAYSRIKPHLPELNLKDILIKHPADYSHYISLVFNDFEEVVFSEYPVIGNIKEKMYNLGARFALMTGTGSTLFGIYPDIISAKKAEDFFKEKYFTFIHLEK